MDPILRAKSVSMPASQVGRTGKTDEKEKKGGSYSFFILLPKSASISYFPSEKYAEQNICAGKKWEYPVSKMKSTLTLPPFSPSLFFDVTAL